MNYVVYNIHISMMYDKTYRVLRTEKNLSYTIQGAILISYLVNPRATIKYKWCERVLFSFADKEPKASSSQDGYKDTVK